MDHLTQAAMNIIEVKSGTIITFGHEGENLSTRVEYGSILNKWQKEFGGSNAQLFAQCPTETAPHPPHHNRSARRTNRVEYSKCRCCCYWQRKWVVENE